jgi:hypothetical protein
VPSKSALRCAGLVLPLAGGLSVGLVAAIAGALGGGAGSSISTGVVAYACGPSALAGPALCTASGPLGPVGNGPSPIPQWTLPQHLPSQVRLVASYALAQLGKPYVWGAAGPESFDCSGLVQTAFAQAGVSLPRTTFDQVDVGTPIYVASQALPGDLVFFTGSDPGPTGAPGHVGIYLGGGQMVHAPQTGDVVRIAPVEWSAVVAIRREIA